jgi:hypothetical protein
LAHVDEAIYMPQKWQSQDGFVAFVGNKRRFFQVFFCGSPE